MITGKQKHENRVSRKKTLQERNDPVPVKLGSLLRQKPPLALVYPIKVSFTVVADLWMNTACRRACRLVIIHILVPP